MQPLLYLTHRIPFPPDKGDKVRSFHLLQQLASSFEVHLGTFIDDPADIVHLDKLNTFCASVKAVTTLSTSQPTWEKLSAGCHGAVGVAGERTSTEGRSSASRNSMWSNPVQIWITPSRR